MSHSDVSALEGHRILGCDAVYFGRQLPSLLSYPLSKLSGEIDLVNSYESMAIQTYKTIRRHMPNDQLVLVPLLITSLWVHLFHYDQRWLYCFLHWNNPELSRP